MPQDHAPTFDEFMDDMRARYPILFKGGAGCEEAVASLAQDIVNDLKEFMRQSAIQDIASSLAVILNDDLVGLQKDGLTEEDRDALLQNPDEVLYGLLEETYVDIIESVNAMGKHNVRVVENDEPCDCPAHGGASAMDPKGELDADFGAWDRKKMGQA